MDFNAIKLIFQKNLPEIMVGIGITGTVVATGLACKATLSIEEELDHIQESSTEIKNTPDDMIDKPKELTKVYAKGAARIAKLYAPAAIIGAASIGSIIYGHDILRKRNLAMAACYELVDQSYKSYRSRVAEKFGDEVEKELCYGLTKEDIEYTETAEDGTEKTRKKKGAVVDTGSAGSPYSVRFNEGCINWKNNAERNLYFLRMMQSEANDMLNARGHLFLNEVYDLLGFPRTKDGQLVGWIRGGNDVDFGIYTVFGKENNDFTNGYSPTCILDFNVDGLIYNKI